MHTHAPLPLRVQSDVFGSTFDLGTAGAADLPKDILIPGAPNSAPPPPL